MYYVQVSTGRSGGGCTNRRRKDKILLENHKLELMEQFKNEFQKHNQNEIKKYNEMMEK